MIFSFVFFMFLFLLVGVASVRKSVATKRDYYMASSSVKPWLVGLSAVATNNSGYMFIGVIGYTYSVGLSAFWVMVGWISGDFLASLFIHRRLRDAAGRTGAVSYAGVLSDWFGGSFNGLQRAIGLLSLLFLMAYAAAQLVAGSKALYVLLDWPLWSGAVLGAVIVAVYCMSGGIRASIWTDAAQSMVMIVAMAVLMWVGLDSLGGVNAAVMSMAEIDGFLSWSPVELVFPGLLGLGLFILSWVFAGFSVVGQPHIMIRFMALDGGATMRRAKLWYYLWFTAFYSMALVVGMLSRIYLSDSATFDAELALPTMAMELLPPVMVGLVLAGVFAATMSTADSLVLSCSSVVTHDLLPRNIERPLFLKLVTLLITLLVLGLALSNNQSVFDLVLLSWSGMASAFAPLLVVLCWGWRPGQNLSLLAMAVGFGVMLLWRYLGLNLQVYEALPGISAGLLVFILWYLYAKVLSASTTESAASAEEA